MPVNPTGWWETERARFVRSRIVDLTSPNELIVDVGCGRGDMLDDASLADRHRVNVDSHVWDEWSQRRGMHFVCARADALPFRPGVFDLVGSFDVLEHLSDDECGFAEQHRVVRHGGGVVTAVPADQRLWSAHDDAVGHHRRYDSGGLERLALGASMRIARQSHFYSFLWLPAWLARKSSLRTTEPAQGAGFMSRAVRVIIGALSGTERIFMRRFSLPFGTSMWCEFVNDGDDAQRSPLR